VPRLERQIEGLDAALVERVVEQFLVLEPEARAILLTGSYATGTAAVASDLDLVALTPSPRTPYRTWFENERTDTPLHVSAGATTVGAWVAKGTTPARWSLGFPAINTAVYLWTDDETRGRLGDDPSLRHPAAEPELEDFLDFVLKAKRAAHHDDLGLRWFAQAATSLAPILLIPLNDERVVQDRRDALDAALSLTVAPENYAGDLATCLGLASASDAVVKTAVARLGKDLITFLRERAPDVDQQPELARYLADGTLERHLESIE
jgi:hypothetical protein